LRSLHAVSTDLESEKGTLGVRIPDDPFIRDLVRAFKKPLTATSANPSGYSSFYSKAAILHGFPKGRLQFVDLLIDSGDLPRNKPSTVVDLTQPVIKTLRKGDIVFSDTKTFISDSPEETQRIAQYLLSKKLSEQTNKPVVFILKGELGAGKTVFVKGVGHALGIENIISPTYVIYYEYDSSHEKISKLYHFDLFQITEAAELKELVIQNLLKPGCLFCFEWGEKAGKIITMLSEIATLVYIETLYLSETKRKITVQY
ncbi:tRNA (adenosine(37)-N6)-threonylcarbamoyltransferase complex ATPase subunit type 1 TsaE, partial [Candidatus Roizmanbacteria bacterium CG09_land_8_20_14_0_10_41_9]